MSRIMITGGHEIIAAESFCVFLAPLVPFGGRGEMLG
jgi:hypothetical protein